MPRKRLEVRSLKKPFAKRIPTEIWQEVPDENNDYIAESCRCHGYDLMELLEKRNYFDIFYLLFHGELPGKDESVLLEKLSIALLNLGPRHPATRAAMYAGIGKTNTAHILPIANMAMGGDALGANEVERSISFFRNNAKSNPVELANNIIKEADNEKDKYDVLSERMPGFGQRFGGIDVMPQKFADYLIKLPGAGKSLTWGNEFAGELNKTGYGWLITGVAAAVFADLGFQPQAGVGLFQLLCSPGLFAHGLEMSNKPLKEMPFPEDKDYVIEK